MTDSLLSLFAQGAGGFDALGMFIYLLVATHITIVSVTVYLHRYSAHRALDLHPVLQHFFRFWLWLTTGMTTKAWTAIHRKHHAMCETEDDPHSPQIKGLATVFWKGSELYRAEAANDETLAQYGQGTPDDWMERHVYSRRSSLGIYLLMAINITLFGAIGLALWAVQMMWIPVLAAGVINGVGHYWGYRNYECDDASRNISPVGILIGGEELHNNHHTFPNSARLSNKWWEFDIGWFYIRLFEMMGLARVKKVAPRPRRDASKTVLDMDSLRGIVSNRFQVMARYRREVILPTIRYEKARAQGEARRLYARARSLLGREESLLSPAAIARRQELLAQSELLKTVHEYRIQLQAVWGRTSTSTQERFAELKDWCARAEASGVQCLQEFAMTLRTYVAQQTGQAA